MTSGHWDDSWDDNYIINITRTAEPHPGAIFYLPKLPAQSNVYILCKDTVVKRIPRDSDATCPEAQALQFVQKHTDIPVPKIRRYINNNKSTSDTKGYLVLERIDGAPLDKIWKLLGRRQQSVIATTLQDYVRKIRKASIEHPRSFPGPVGDTPKKCFGAPAIFGQDPEGPFSTSQMFIEHVNQQFKCNLLSSPLVLTHGDLGMHNIIMDAGGKLWLVGWGNSGFYPTWVEGVSMAAIAKEKNADATWVNMISTVAGDCELEKAALKV